MDALQHCRHDTPWPWPWTWAGRTAITTPFCAHAEAHASLNIPVITTIYTNSTNSTARGHRMLERPQAKTEAESTQLVATHTIPRPHHPRVASSTSAHASASAPNSTCIRTAINGNTHSGTRVSTAAAAISTHQHRLEGNVKYEHEHEHQHQHAAINSNAHPNMRVSTAATAISTNEYQNLLEGNVKYEHERPHQHEPRTVCDAINNGTLRMLREISSREQAGLKPVHPTIRACPPKSVTPDPLVVPVNPRQPRVLPSHAHCDELGAKACTPTTSDKDDREEAIAYTVGFQIETVHNLPLIPEAMKDPVDMRVARTPAGWEPWVLVLSAKDRNRLARTLQLPHSVTMELKAESRKRKQRVSQREYKQRKRAEANSNTCQVVQRPPSALDTPQQIMRVVCRPGTER